MPMISPKVVISLSIGSKLIAQDQNCNGATYIVELFTLIVVVVDELTYY